MLELWSAPTGDGRRPLIMLEESGLSYALHRVDLMKGEQKSAAFLALNSAGAIPVLKDGDIALAQSGAILLHLADKTGKL
ncbi:MAG: glutathione S-transferase family protein, partial [Alphaproteobacteria bacterium]|nr:glutathione S-transferase family protein [Alphaproteobacteria bacterium]